MHADQIATTMHLSRRNTQHRRRRAWVAVPIGMGALALAAACQPYAGTSNAASSASAPASAPASSAGGAVVAAASTGLGTVLVNADGRTVYDFANDKGSTSTCYGECANDWMPVAAPGAMPASVPDVPAQLGSTQRNDGTMQLTVGGHPVYTFEGDSAAGQTNGNGLRLNGGLWTAVSPIGSPLATDGSSSGSSTSGY